MQLSAGRVARPHARPSVSRVAPKVVKQPWIAALHDPALTPFSSADVFWWLMVQPARLSVAARVAVSEEVASTNGAVHASSTTVDFEELSDIIRSAGPEMPLAGMQLVITGDRSSWSLPRFDCRHISECGR